MSDEDLERDIRTLGAASRGADRIVASQGVPETGDDGDSEDHLPAPSRIYGVLHQGTLCWNGIPQQRFKTLYGVFPPSRPGVFDNRAQLTERARYTPAFVEPNHLPVQAIQPVVLPFVSYMKGEQHGVELTNAGAYLVYGDASTGKSLLARRVMAMAGGAVISLTEPDGPGYPGDAAGYSAAAIAIEDMGSSGSPAALDSLLTASVYGEALAAGGIAKSVFLLAGFYDLVARLSRTIVLVVLNPLSGSSDTEARKVIRTAAMATTQGVIFTNQAEMPTQDTVIINAQFSVRPHRQIVQHDISFTLDEYTTTFADLHTYLNQ